MEYRVKLEAMDEGAYLATCDDPQVWARGMSPANALDRLRAELRYVVELCPCSGVDDDYIELRVNE